MSVGGKLVRCKKERRRDGGKGKSQHTFLTGILTFGCLGSDRPPRSRATARVPPLNLRRFRWLVGDRGMGGVRGVPGEPEGLFSVATGVFTTGLGFAVDGGRGGRGTEVFVFVTSGVVTNGLGVADGGGSGGGSWGAFINREKNLGGCVNKKTNLGVCKFKLKIVVHLNIIVIQSRVQVGLKRRVFELMMESKGEENGILTRSMARSPSTVNFEGGGAGGGRCICDSTGAGGCTN